MQVTKAQTSNKNTFLLLVARFVLGILKRLFIRVFFVPFYAALAVPWLVLIDSNEMIELEKVAYKITAFLAGNPNSQSLNENDLAKAVLILFVGLDIILEIINYFRGKRNAGPSEYSLRRRMYIQWALSVIGWTTLGISSYSEQGITTLMILVAFGIVFCAFFWMEYSFRQIFEKLKF